MRASTRVTQGIRPQQAQLQETVARLNPQTLGNKVVYWAKRIFLNKTDTDLAQENRANLYQHMREKYNIPAKPPTQSKTSNKQPHHEALRKHLKAHGRTHSRIQLFRDWVVGKSHIDRYHRTATEISKRNNLHKFAQERDE